MFEIEKSKVHTLRAPGNYQQSSVAKRAAHTSIVEMAIHFYDQKRHMKSSSVTRTTEASRKYLQITHGGQAQRARILESIWRNNCLAIDGPLGKENTADIGAGVDRNDGGPCFQVR